jgi:23S rRNA (adenine2503-C2)-methyltransferase
MMANALYLAELSLAGLTDWLAAQGEPAYRAKQIYRHLYHGLAEDFSQMTDLPVALRDRLGQAVLLNPLRLLAEQRSADGQTRKALFELPDGQTIESVLMLYGPGGTGDVVQDRDAEKRPRRTVCLSTQVGCAMGCAFCATGKSGLQRSLTAGEIVAQTLYFARELRKEDPAAGLTNLIYAGMGEPLVNYEATVESVHRLNDPVGFGLGARHMTISTAGWVPGIQRLASEGLQVGLAVSLHAPDDALRSRLMPINRRYPVSELMAACREYVERTGRRVSFEYILIAGVNAAVDQARKLASLLRGMLCHVNLIPMNPVEGVGWQPPARVAVRAFERVLAEAGIAVTVREERGSDIRAACGQLRARRTARTTDAGVPA